MKPLLISIFMLLLSFTATANADYQDEINSMTARLPVLSTSDAGMNDSGRSVSVRDNLERLLGGGRIPSVSDKMR